MAGKKDDHKTTNGHGARVKFRLLELDVEGGTPELVESFKTFAATLARSTAVTTPVRSLTAAKATNTSTAVADPPVDEQENLVDVSETEMPEEVSSEAVVDNGVERPKRRPVPKAPKFLSDLNLTTAKVQLSDFVKEKNPTGDMDKYAVIAAGFNEYFSTEEVTIDHVFTAYNSLGWKAQMPEDPSQTFRNLKSSKNWVDSGSQRGAYKINWAGLNAVNKMGAAKE